MYARCVLQVTAPGVTTTSGRDDALVGRRLPWRSASRAASRAALRAGGLAYLAAQMVVALAAFTAWAGETEFPGHQHPWGTEDHVHGLDEVIGAWANLAAPVSLPRTQTLALLALLTVLTFVQALPWSSHRSRAPPAVPRLHRARPLRA